MFRGRSGPRFCSRPAPSIPAKKSTSSIRQRKKLPQHGSQPVSREESHDSAARDSCSIAACAFELKPDVDVRPGTVYRGVVERSYSPVTTPHLFSVAPFLWDEPFEPFDDDDVHVTWLQLVPITDAEAAYAKSHGADALEAAFMQAQPDVFSITRESVPLPIEGD